MTKRLVLIDGHAILHRAYYAFSPTLKTRKGELVNAVYGFTRMLLTVLKDLKPNFVAVAWDLPEPTFRHREFIGYQAQRPKMDFELKDQMKRVREVIGVLGIPLFAVAGFEADDVIGTLARQAAEDIKISRYKDIKKRKKKKKSRNIPVSQYPNIEVVVVTGDKDIMQLVNKKVKVYAPVKGLAQAKLFGPKEVEELLGVRPDQIVDYKALVGDPSDNYPGVPGVGPKTAVELLGEYGDLDTIYSRVDKIRPSVAQKLKEEKESAYLSQKLAKIVTNVPIKLKLKACRVHDYDQKKAIELFEELEFKSLIGKLPGYEREEEKRKENEQMKIFE